MFRKIANNPFKQFNRNVLTEEENEILDGGIVKHTRILKWMLSILPIQLSFAYVAPEIFTLLSAVAILALLLGGAWYTISFQNVSADQLDAGVADYITFHMFRAFMVCLSALGVSLSAYFGATLVPEFFVIELETMPVLLRVLLLVGNIWWVVLTIADIWRASVGYDAADSLLGDGFPTLMRGANANAQNIDTAKNLEMLANNIEELLKQRTPQEND